MRYVIDIETNLSHDCIWMVAWCDETLTRVKRPKHWRFLEYATGGHTDGCDGVHRAQLVALRPARDAKGLGLDAAG